MGEYMGILDIDLTTDRRSLLSGNIHIRHVEGPV